MIKAQIGLDQVTSAESTAEGSEAEESPSTVVSDCQECVELCAKAIFVSVGVEPVEEHAISLSHEKVEGVLNRLPADPDMDEEVQRVIFLTTVWEPYYEFSTYGVPEYQIAPEDVVTESDGRRAISHAEFCLEVSERLHECKMNEFGYDVTDFDLA